MATQKTQRADQVETAICEGVAALASAARSIVPSDAWSYMLLRLASEKMLYEIRAALSPAEAARVVAIADQEVEQMRSAADRLLIQREEGKSMIAEALGVVPFPSEDHAEEPATVAASRKSDAPPAPAG
jgi:hypothetical protein